MKYFLTAIVIGPNSQKIVLGLTFLMWLINKGFQETVKFFTIQTPLKHSLSKEAQIPGENPRLSAER